MVVWRGTETKTRYCQPLRHRNRHPPRETLNHFYCIELSLLPAERTSKRALSLFRAPPAGYLFSPSFLSLPPAPFARSFPALVLRRSSPSCRLRSLSLFAPSPSLPSVPLVSDGREIIRTRKRSHPFGCPNGISSLIRGFTAEQTNRPRCRRDNIRRTKEDHFLAELLVCRVFSSKILSRARERRQTRVFKGCNKKFYLVIFFFPTIYM